jgi:ActR/RegA family two-component response regulator
MPADDLETILLVEDEESVRQTFREWLEGTDLHCRILIAADAESALVLANQHTVDLAILDWNLGAGHDGLQLLEDLAVFNPDVAAILVTGFAHQATPLHALRMGVRDYLDKNQDLDRTTFLRSVRKQLERIRPVKRERRLHQRLMAFREAVDKILPLVRAGSALNDPVPLPDAVASLFRFLLHITGARDGVLVARSYDPSRTPAEDYRAYDAAGNPLEVALIPFARSVAGAVVSFQEPYVLNHPAESIPGGVELQPFERDRNSLLAAPLTVASGIHVVLELLDKTGPDGRPSAAGFGDADKRALAAAGDLGAALLRQALAEPQTHAVLFDALAAAAGAGDSLADSLRGSEGHRAEEPPSADVLRELSAGFDAAPAGALAGEDTVRLAEAIRVLALRHGPAGVRHCVRLVEGVRDLLDEVTGADRPTR